MLLLSALMFLLFIIFLLGLTFGSFANVLIWRLPRGKKITGRSICPKCFNRIKWYDNIPLLSFSLLKGKCRNCKRKISLRYPMVELATGVIFLLLYLKFGFSTEFLLFSLVAVLLIAIFVIDLTSQIIPDELVFAGIAIVLLFPIPHSLYANLFAGFSAALFLLLTHLITKGKGMGLGDVKFAILGGVLVGLTNVFQWLFLAFLTGASVGCILILIKKLKLKSKIVFGPFLVFALFLVILFKL